MTIEQFENGILAFDNGEVPFNQGNSIASFLFNNKWYPIRAFALFCTGNQNITTQVAIKMITCLIPYTRIAEKIDYTNSNGFPIQLTNQQRLVELQHLKFYLNQLIG